MTQISRERTVPGRCTTLGLTPSFGFGDRIGFATVGHVDAMKRAGDGIAPIFPQQSIREMARTGRSPEVVMADALAGMDAAAWTGVTGADADHLKTTQDVDATSSAGFTFFTIDPSDDVDAHADDYDEAALRTKFSRIAAEVDWLGKYLGKEIRLSTGTKVELSEAACMRAAVKYGRALNKAITLGKHIASVQERAGRGFEIELSVDETEQPTTMAEHYIIADQCLDRGMRLVSLAPRYVGDFEKGVDYKGDLFLLEHSLLDHAAIAEMLGPYKLSLHSGSDKISIYSAIARASKGRFHVKTAGTSYLEALRVVARHDHSLFRSIVTFARSRYDEDKQTYHVSATLASAPSVKEDSDPVALERAYLELWAEVPKGRGFTTPGRQILHCTFGSVLKSPEFGATIRSILESHQDTYTEMLSDHFVHHLDALREGL